MDAPPNPLQHARRRRIGAAVCAGAGVLAASTAVAARRRAVPGESGVLGAVNGLPGAARLPLEVAMSAGTAWAAAAVAAAGLLTRRPAVAVAAVGAWAATRVTCTVAKAVIDRPRPSLLLADVVVRGELPHDAGFPSSHSAIAAALAVVVGWAWPWARVPAAVVAVAVGLGRLAVGVHLPLDVVGGWALGALVGAGVVALVESRAGQ